MNPFNPMESVLSLQTYDFGAEPASDDTNGCISTCCITLDCPKDEVPGTSGCVTSGCTTNACSDDPAV